MTRGPTSIITSTPIRFGEKAINEKVAPKTMKNLRDVDVTWLQRSRTSARQQVCEQRSNGACRVRTSAT